MKLNLFNREHPELPVYPDELPTLDPYEDDGRMQENVEELQTAVVGRRIVNAEILEFHPYEGSKSEWLAGMTKKSLTLTLDNGRRVRLVDTDDCCAYTEVREFLLHPEAIDHMILGVGTTDKYETWHIYADFGDIMAMNVAWSCGNPFYYGYGFDIQVHELED
jgi:hypothetical protein